MPATAYPAQPHKHLRILMLHGFTQSGSLFHAKTRALEKTLTKTFAPTGGITLVYPTGPHRIRPSDIPSFLNPSGEAGTGSDGKAKSNDDDSDCWGWWIRRGTVEPYAYDGMDEGLARIAQTLKAEGPFDGVVGFSQGGAVAGVVASLLEPGRRTAFADRVAKGGMPYPAAFGDDEGMVEGVVHPPLKFAVSYSGYGASANTLYQAFYEPKIVTPMLHVLGSVDTVVEERLSMRLVNGCVEGEGENGKRVVRHPGGHFLPSTQKEYVNALVNFIKEVMGWDQRVAKEDERAEDMDVPF